MKCSICGAQRNAHHALKRCSMAVGLGARYERRDGSSRYYFKVVGVVVYERSFAVGEVVLFEVKEFSHRTERFSMPARYSWRMMTGCRKLGPEEKVI